MQDSLTLFVAGHRLKVDGSEEVSRLLVTPGFPVFVVPDEDVEWLVAFKDQIPRPSQWEELYAFDFEELNVRSVFARVGQDYYYAFDSLDGRRSPVLMRYGGGNTVESTHCSEPFLLRFLLWMAYGMLAAPQKALLIHSSVIVHQGRAVLFLGESGTGKSTHTRLWLEHIPDSHLLNDDSPVLAVEGGIPVVYGSPWSGKTHCYHQLRFPLAAAVRLSQAPYNKIDKLNVLGAFSSLQPSCSPALAQDSHFSDLIVDILSDVVSSVPVFHLSCLPDRAAALTSHDAIFGPLL